MATKRGGVVSLAQAAKPSVLSLLAQNMKTCAASAQGGAVHRKLSRGLHIVFARLDGRCRLAVGREAPGEPSQDELVTVAQAFAAPVGAEPCVRQAVWKNPQTQRQVTFNVLELTWREAPKG
jgi:hypothetical protein